MSRKIVQKVIDELSKDNPDISYVRGILDTFVETLPEERREAPKPIMEIPRATKAPSLDVPTVGGPLFPDVNSMISTE